jgi:hypothetical protein
MDDISGLEDMNENSGKTNTGTVGGSRKTGLH